MKPALLLGTLLLAGCSATLRPAPVPDASLLHGFDAADFPGAATLLSGFAAPATDPLGGDTVLFGLEVHDGADVERRMLLLELGGLSSLWSVDGFDVQVVEHHPRRTVTMTLTTQDGKAIEFRREVTPLPVLLRQFDAAGKELGASMIELFEEPLRAGFWPLTLGEQDVSLDEHMMAVLLLTTMRQLGQSDRTLRELLFTVVERPSLWSVVFHFGIAINVTAGVGAPCPPLPSLPVTEPLRLLPLELLVNGALALSVDLALVQPKPPLLTAGGVVGAVARHPSRPERFALLRLLASRRGPAAPTDAR